jgi:hypothetical protein
MADISSHTFVIRGADQLDFTARAVRRIFVNSDAIKMSKLYAGDVVALAAAEAADLVQPHSSETCHRKVCMRVCYLVSRINAHIPDPYLESTLCGGGNMAVIRISH